MEGDVFQGGYAALYEASYEQAVCSLENTRIMHSSIRSSKVRRRPPDFVPLLMDCDDEVAVCVMLWDEGRKRE